MTDSKLDFTSVWQEHLRQYAVPTVLKAQLLKPYFCSIVKAGQHILDVGCGTGYFSELLSAQGALVTAIDACDEFFPANSKVQYHKMTATTFHFPGNVFDAILMINVMSCIGKNEQRILALTNAAKYKSSQGKLYVLHGSEELWDHPLSSDLLKTRTVGDQIEWDVKKTDGSRLVFVDNIIRKQEMIELAEKAKLSIQEYIQFRTPGISQAIYDLYALI